MKKYISLKLKIIIWMMLSLYPGLTARIFSQYIMMPIGDSITEGKTGSSDGKGFLNDLESCLTSNGISFQYVGPVGTAPYKGHFYSGAEIQEFYQGGYGTGQHDISQHMENYQPTILLIHLGTNNVDAVSPIGPYGNGSSFSKTQTGYLAQFIEYALKWKNGINGSFLQYIVISKIIPRNGFVDQVKEFNVEVDDIYIDSEDGRIPSIPPGSIRLANHYHGYQMSWLSDGTHPNDTGYAHMGSVYCDVMRKIHNEGTSDTKAPATPVLTTVSTTKNSITINWTAPGDDGTSGTATLYELRHSRNGALTASNFDDGELVEAVPKPSAAGTSETVQINDLSGTRWIALRVWDENGNVSAVSNNLNATFETDIPKHCDSFDRNILGDNWDAPGYVISNGTLDNSSSSSGWGDLAVYKKAKKVNRIEFVWSEDASNEGANAGGAAFGLASPYSNSNGYVIIRRDYWLSLYNFNGVDLVSIDKQPSKLASPRASDKMEYIWEKSDNGNYFKVRINGAEDVVLKDPNFLYNYDNEAYSGVMLYGGSENNNIDDYCAGFPPGPPEIIKKEQGDGASAPVTTRLSVPLEVQVTDINGLPISDQWVNFSVTSGCGYLSTDTLNFNGNIWREAESGTISPPMEKGNDAGASGGQFVTLPSPNWSSGSIDFTIYIIEEANYRFWGRFKTPDGSSNSAFVLIDGDTLTGKKNYLDLPIRTEWDWQKGDLEVKFLTKGFHTLRIGGRENRVGIDKVLLTSSGSFVPTGLGGESQQFDNITDSLGMAKTFITFCETAGEYQVLADAGSGLTTTFSVYATAANGHSIQEVSGNGQSGTPGEPLEEPFVVKVKDRYNNAVPGHMVNFRVTVGNGSVAPLNMPTDSKGEASSILTLGTEGDQNVVEASAPGLAGSPVTFQANADYYPETMIPDTTANHQTAAAGTALPKPLKVRILDGNDLPVPGYDVAFTIKSGSGTITPSNSKTNIDGYAEVIWTLGPMAGKHIVEVACFLGGVHLNGSPYRYEATALVGDPYQLHQVSGNGQSPVPIGMRTPQPFVVKVTDKNNNPISNHQVTFSVEQGGGNIDGNQQKVLNTDANGQAQVYLTIGATIGVTNRVKAVAFHNGLELAGSPKIFEVQSAPGQPTDLQYLAGRGQRQKVTTTLQNSFKVRVTDPFDHPKQNIAVRFTVIAGNGKIDGNSFKQVNTNAEGLAEVIFTLGTQAGKNSNIVHATAEYNGAPLEGSPVQFNVVADPDNPDQLVKVTQDSLTGSVLQRLDQPIQVKVADKYGNGIFGQVVTFTVVAGDGKLDGLPTRSPTTDSSGIAQVFWSLGPVLGDHNNKLEAVAKDRTNNHLLNSPALFFASADHAPAAKLIKFTTKNLSGRVGETLLQPFCAQVTDEYGNPVDGYPIRVEVKSGGGTIGGSQFVVRNTDETGQVCIYLTLGIIAGTNNNIVEASAASLQNSPIQFYASAIVGPPIMLTLLSGGDQTGTVGKPLAVRIKAKVSDQYNNAIYGHKVSFLVKEGDGHMGSLKKRDMYTLPDGSAEVEWTMGKVPGINNNKLEVTADNEGLPLDGSPLIVNATATSDKPYVIGAIDSLEGYKGIVGNPLHSFFQVLVSDRWSNPIENFPVKFKVTNGGGLFVGNSRDTATVKTDYYGISRVQLELGPLAGTNINKVSASAVYENNALIGSPLIFMASGQSSNATKLNSLVNISLSGTVGKSLPPIKVQALDHVNNPVKGHPIIFTVTKGGGTVGDSTSICVVSTDDQGMAETRWKLGKVAGSGLNELKVNATRDGINPLAGAPIIFVADAVPEIPSFENSEVEIFGEAKANGIDKIKITSKLKDKFGNLVPGRFIQIESNDPLDNITQPSGPSSSAGIVIAYIASIRAGAKYLSVKDLGANMVIADSIKIYFLPGSPSRLDKISGDEQAGPVGIVLPQPFVVKVVDDFGNGIPDQQIRFEVTEGGGRIIEPQLLPTDNSGKAGAFLRLGKNQGYNRVKVTCQALPTRTAEFRAAGYMATPAAIVKISGDNQAGQAGAMLRQPICVQVQDVMRNPLWGIPVTFASVLGNGRILEPQPDTTDENGQVWAHWILGNQIGPNTVRATVPGLASSVLFQANGSAGSPAKLQVISGNDQEGCVGKAMPEHLVVQSTDLNGNAVGNVSIEFVIIQGMGQVSPTGPQFTDGSGYAYARITPGNTAGEYIVAARSTGLQPVEFSLVAIGCDAYRMEAKGGNNQTGTFGRELVYPVEVRIYDIYNNPVGGTPVIFQASGGSVPDPQPIFSNGNGLARARWQLGREQGNYRLDALNYQLHGSPVQFYAIAVANAFPLFNFTVDTIAAQEEKYLNFSIEATDEDQDQLFYTPLDLPIGAYINPSDKTLNWYPTRGTVGNHRAKFRVEDTKGGFDVDSLIIKVVRENHPPQILSWTPPNSQINYLPPGAMTFCINVIDQDRDSLRYDWRLDGQQKSTDSCCVLTEMDISWSRTYELVVNVSDGKAMVSTAWRWWITQVELESFIAVPVVYKGVQLEWKTTRETDNAGFNVYRSQKETGEYEKLNQALIPSNNKGDYSFVDKTVQAGNTYYYKLESVDVTGHNIMHDVISVHVSMPKRFALEQNYPNPFNPRTTIRFEIPKTSRVRLIIYNMMGQLVMELVNREMEPGYHSVTWDGLNRSGQIVGAGIYYYYMEAADFNNVKKMILLK